MQGDMPESHEADRETSLATGRAVVTRLPIRQRIWAWMGFRQAQVPFEAFDDAWREQDIVPENWSVTRIVGRLTWRGRLRALVSGNLDICMVQWSSVTPANVRSVTTIEVNRP